MALGAAKFLGPIGLILTAGMAAVEGVSAGVEEFKESGDLGRAVAEGLGGVASSLTFGAIDKDTVADFLQNPLAQDKQGANLSKRDITAKRLKDLEKQLQLTEGATDPRSKALRKSRLEEMKSLEAKLAATSSAGATVNSINQDNSVRQTSQTTQSQNIVVFDPAMGDVLVANM